MDDDIIYSRLSKKQADLLSRTHNNNAASKPSDVALKQMEKMGWKEGTGLGKNADGITESIQVKRREENEGLGHKEKVLEEKNENWWFNCYDSAAKKLKSPLDDSSSSSSDSESENEKQTSPTASYGIIYSDEQLFAACKGRRLGMRARASQNGKWKRVNDEANLPSLSPLSDVEEEKKEKKHKKDKKDKKEKKHKKDKKEKSKHKKEKKEKVKHKKSK